MVETANHGDTVHYSLWFWIRDEANERDVIDRVRSFLTDLKERDAIGAFTVLKNRAAGGTTLLGPFQVLVTFRSSEQFSAAFEAVARIGVHSGPHGAMVDQVSRFHAETFDVLA